MSQSLECTSESSPIYGPEPFHADGKGDIILKSSNGVHFKALKAILALASPVFSDMFDIPQSPHDSPSDLHIIDLTESSQVVHAMLVLFYPAPVLEIKSHSTAFGLVRAFDKYIVNLQALRSFLKDFLTEESMQGSPLESYALAWRLGWKEKAEVASRYLHERNLAEAEVQNYLLQHAEDVGALTSLWDLRLRREHALSRFIQDLPLDTYRCPNHVALSAQEYVDLQQSARKVLATPFPERRLADVLPSLIKWQVPREIDVTARKVTGLLLIPTHSIRMRAPSTSTLGPCHECRQAATFASADIGEQRLRCVAAAVEAFPKTIKWTRQEK